MDLQNKSENSDHSSKLYLLSRIYKVNNLRSCKRLDLIGVDNCRVRIIHYGKGHKHNHSNRFIHRI